MVKITRVYTRTGDQGNTSLVGGSKTTKDDPRVGCYGTVDELNCLLGVARGFNAQKQDGSRRNGLDKLLQMMQQRLFDLGSQLATLPKDHYEGQVIISKGDVAWLEGVIDTLNSELPPLQSFILPGGGTVSAFLHQGRAVCRRAERLTVALAREQEVEDQVVPFLNRLSDALFVMSRWVALTMGEEEVLWESGLQLDDSWQLW